MNYNVCNHITLCFCRFAHALHCDASTSNPPLHQAPNFRHHSQGYRNSAPIGSACNSPRWVHIVLSIVSSDTLLDEWQGYSRPRQIRGPPLNGMYSQVREDAFSSHRSGLNSSASGPQMSFRRCIEYKLKGMSVFFLTKIGPLPSGPPPRGREVSLNDNRLLMGTGGRRRRARITTLAIGHDLIVTEETLPSLRTYRKYRMFLILAWVISPVGWAASPYSLIISRRNRSHTAGACDK